MPLWAQIYLLANEMVLSAGRYMLADKYFRCPPVVCFELLAPPNREVLSITSPRPTYIPYHHMEAGPVEDGMGQERSIS